MAQSAMGVVRVAEMPLGVSFPGPIEPPRSSPRPLLPLLIEGGEPNFPVSRETSLA
jgi:hypothetical protein